MRYRFMVMLLAIVTGCLLFDAAPAAACPMCKVATENDAEALQPRAYMYSILFMMGMMASVTSLVGVVLYRANKRERAALEEAGYGHVLVDALQASREEQDRS